MAKAVKRAAESWRYVLTADRELPPEEQTTFSLRPLTQAERAWAQDNLARTHFRPDGAREAVQRTHQLARELCLTNIEGIENFPAGEPKAWPESREDRERYLEQLDDAAVTEVGNQIWERSQLEPAAKNSSTPGATSTSGAA
jgi:hypothetical protein